MQFGRTAFLRRHSASDHFVNIAPDPVFSRLNRAHHGMAALMEMFGCVFVLRRIATSHLPADHTHSQMNPSVADLHALFADVLVGARNLDLIQMLALRSH
jgi:hypothetical protein